MKRTDPEASPPAAESDRGGRGRSNPADPLLELTRTYTDTLGSLATTMQTMLSGAANPLLEQSIRRMMEPRAWLGLGGGWSGIDQQLEHLLDRPQLADLQEIDRKGVKAVTALLELQQASAEHQLLMANTLNQAFQRFLGRLAEPGKDGKPVSSWQEVTSLWTETANQAMVEAQRSEEMLAVQRRLLKSALRYRAQEREAAEKLCERSHIPTRTEMDEVHRTIHDLKREIRTLKRALAKASGDRPRRQPARKAEAERPVKAAAGT